MTRNAAPALIEAGPFERFRRGVPALKRKTYLSVCDKMIPHDRVRAAVDRFPDPPGGGFGDAGGHGFSSDAAIAPLSKRLEQARVIHKISHGQLRFAVHAYNIMHDIGHMIDVMAEALKGLYR